MLLLVGDALVANQGDDVFVENVALAVGQVLEARERRIDVGFAVELDSEFLQPLLEGVAS